MVGFINSLTSELYISPSGNVTNDVTDYLKSTLHRVTAPQVHEPGSNGVANGVGHLTRSRYSIPYFVSPDPTAVVECLSQCTGEGNPAKYAPVKQADYQRMRATLQYS